jgi:hypothetical protein
MGLFNVEVVRRLTDIVCSGDLLFSTDDVVKV